MDINKFKELPVLGIVRGVSADIIEPLMEAAISSGLESIEITMNTPEAASLIRKSVDFTKGRINIGAGTVLSMHDLKAALGAGATFVVMPIVVDSVIAYCVKKKIPVFPGAMTPLEIYNAWQKGATMVKVFPAKFLGPEYFKEIKGPFGDIELLACAGITPENMKDYFAYGASAVSFGASVFKKEWLEKKDFASVRKGIKAFVDGFRNL